MRPWRVNQSYEKNLDSTLEAKPSHVMHSQYHCQFNEAGQLDMDMLLLVHMPDIVLEKGSKHMTYVSQMMELCMLMPHVDILSIFVHLSFPAGHGKQHGRCHSRLCTNRVSKASNVMQAY